MKKTLINSYKFESKNMGIGTVGLPHDGSLWIGHTSQTD